MKRLSHTIPEIHSKVFSRKYISLGRIVTHWREIVGEELADKAQPLKIHYRKPKDKKKAPTVKLDIAVSSADAVTFHYQKDLILERINTIFGERWITDLGFKHVKSAEKKESAEPRRSVLNEQDKKNLSEMLENINDPDIRTRLHSFGAAFLKDKPYK